MALEFLERPLPKPSDEKHVEARLLEALVEARLALRFLREGLTRNAAGKAFQAWKALLAALLRLEFESPPALTRRRRSTYPTPRVQRQRRQKRGARRLLQSSQTAGGTPLRPYASTTVEALRLFTRSVELMHLPLARRNHHGDHRRGVIRQHCRFCPLRHSELRPILIKYY